MTAIVEHIKKEIENLAPEEAKELFRELRRDHAMVTLIEADEASVQALWDVELDTRADEIESGKVGLISGVESLRRVDALFAKHSLGHRPA